MDGIEGGNEQIQGFVEASRAFAAGESRNAELAWPPDIARKLVELHEKFASTVASAYLRARRLDSPEGFERDAPQMPADLDQLLMQAIEWGSNNAAGFTRVVDAHTSRELPIEDNPDTD